MFSHSTKPNRHALDLQPTHIRYEQIKSFKPKKRCKGKFNPLARGTGIFYIARKNNQRCIIKISYTKNTKTRAWAAHGEYLQREHAQEKGQKGLGFNATHDAIDLKTTLRQWQQENDAHVFRLIISPENGYQMDLKKHVIDLVNQMQKDLKTKLEWAAIDHHNTDHPHLHLLIRGRDEKGNKLIMESDYLSRTIRHRSEELATRELGLRHENDLVHARKRQIDREYVTEIDRSLRHKAINSIVDYHTPIPNNIIARELRLLEIERLKQLEKWGFAEKISAKAWKLSNELESSLQSKQLSNDIIKSRANHNIRTLTHELPAPTLIQENKPLTGKVVGMGLENEIKDHRYLLLEGIDGKVHYIQATNSIIKARDNFKFHNENVVTLEKKKFTNAQGKVIEYVHVTNHFNLKELQQSPSSRLDHNVIEFVKNHGIKPTINYPEKSFAHEYASAMTTRFDELQKEKIFIQNENHYNLALDWQKKLNTLIKKREQENQHELEIKHGYVNTLDLNRGRKKSHENTQKGHSL